MKYLVNSREMKQYDTNTMEHFGVPSMVLMERAAMAVVEEIKNRNVDLTRVLVVCGQGNNGGDGLAIARMLYLDGCAVDVVLFDAFGKASEQNRAQQKILQAYGAKLLKEIPERNDYTLVIDAIFGVGLSRQIEGACADLIGRLNDMAGMKLAVDISSGISSDNGSVLGVAFRADWTVAFAYAKVGQLLWPGNEYTGEIVVRDIGIESHSWLERKPAVAALETSDIARMLPKRKSHSNKGTYGKLLVIAGSVDMAGAAVLCARAAYAAGCGLVRVFTAEENRVVLQTSVPEAVLCSYSPKKVDIEALTEAIKWADVIVCGPGIGTSETGHQLVKHVLKSAAVPVLLDADALNIISEDTNVLLRPHTEMIVTPHLGEMSRLTGDSVSYIQNRLIEVAEEFARQYNVVCVLKDEHTVTSVPYSQTYLNLSGNSGMATAGSGDVLSGILGGLMAQGIPAEQAAPLGVYLHGLAGDEAAEKNGTRGMVASDMIEGLRRLFTASEYR